MKKQIIAVLAATVVLSGTAGIFTACSEHKHTFSDDWATSSTHHWHAATCEHKDEISGNAQHNFSGNKCTVCQYIKSSVDPVKDTVVEDTSKKITTLVYNDTRIQLFSDSLVRIEDKAANGFEDRESYIVCNKSNWGEKISYTVEKTEEYSIIKTSTYTLEIPTGGDADDITAYYTDGETAYGYNGITGTNVYLPSPSDELSSWYFTDSPRVIPSSYGYSPADNNVPLQGWEFEENVTDIYLFLPAGNYRNFSSDFVSLTGQSEMVELKTFGQWDSRYYAYNEQTALQQIKDYQEKGFAIDVLVVDTDWRDASGGFGYDINTTLFPDMKRFLEEAHKLGVNVCFNDHPQPNGGNNLLDKEEVAYRNEKLTMLLSMGVDNWWYDRNWSVELNQIHPDISRYATGMYAYQWITQSYLESIKDINEYAKRAVIMGNIDGCNNGSYVYASDLSAHRYSIQWTGDIGAQGNWLRQEIEGAIFAGAELGLPYVSADIGGHNVDPSNEEYTRWYQYGALSPILRVHCWNGTTSGGRMPWLYGATAEEVAHTYQDMRYRLLPLYYALAHENYETGLPIMRRLDINYPKYTEAKNNDEYLLGNYILVAPISEWTGKDMREVFFPEGSWIDVWTGKRYSGPNTYKVTHDIKTSPIFVREGALIALAKNMSNVDEKDWSEMSLEVFPSTNYSAKTTLYEDDTKTVAYKDGHFRTTDISMACTGNILKINIGKANGTFNGDRAFTDRVWNVRLHKNTDWGEIKSVRVNGQSVTAQTLAKLTYNTKGRPFAFSGGALDGDIQTFTINTKISEAYEIEIEYESVVRSAVYEDYDATAVKFKVTSEACTESSVNLTALGTTDWVSYGYSLGTNTDYKKGGPRLFSAPEDVRLMLDNPTRQYVALQFKTGLEKTYTNGSKKASNTVKGGTKNSMGYDFTVQTTGNKEKIVLYLGGMQTLAKLTVRDRAGNVKTVYIGNRDEKEFTNKVIIEVEAGQASTLTMQYSPVAYKVNSQNTSSFVTMYCGYVCENN